MICLCLTWVIDIAMFVNKVFRIVEVIIFAYTMPSSKYRPKNMWRFFKLNVVMISEILYNTSYSNSYLLKAYIFFEMILPLQRSGTISLVFSFLRITWTYTTQGYSFVDGSTFTIRPPAVLSLSRAWKRIRNDMWSYVKVGTYLIFTRFLF